MDRRRSLFGEEVPLENLKGEEVALEDLRVEDTESESSDEEESEDSGDEDDVTSKDVLVKNSETAGDLDLKKPGLETSQNKASAEVSSEEESTDDDDSGSSSDSETVSVNKSENLQKNTASASASQTLDVKKDNILAPCPNKVGSVFQPEPKRDVQPTVVPAKKSENLQKNTDNILAPCPNKLGSVPVKRALEDMGQDVPEAKRKPRKGREVALLLKSDSGYQCGLDESTLIQIWDNEVDDDKRRELEEKLAKIRDIQFTLYLEQSQFVAEATKLIVDTLRKRQ